MNEPLTTKELKLFGLPRPTVGGLIGIGIFLLLAVIFWVTKFGTGFILLTSPGLFIRTMMTPWLDNINNSFVQNAAPISIILCVSIIPPAILGMLFASREKTERTLGIAMLVLYLIISMAIGLPIYAGISP